MNDVTYTNAGNSMSIRVTLDSDILQDLIYGGDKPSGADRGEWERQCALREHQVYRLLRSVVSQFNGRLKGRREKMKLIEEGEGLILEFGG